MKMNAGTSTNDAVAGYRDPLHPIGVTHIDFGCLACGDLIKGLSHITPLRQLIAQHKRTKPKCFDNSSSSFSAADCARGAEERQRSNMALFERNRYGDTDGFFNTTGDVSAVQCASCLRCFEKKAEAEDHVRSRRTKCNGATLRHITGRYTIFQTLCPAPTSTRRRTDTDAPPAVSAAAPAALVLRTPAQPLRPAAITPGTAATCTTVTTPASATTGTSTTTAISTVLNAPRAAAATPAASGATPVSFALPAAVMTPAPRAAAVNPYLRISRVEHEMKQSTNPVIQRALRAVRSSLFPPAESKWQTAVRLLKPFVPIGGDVEDYAHIHADLGRPDDVVSKLNGITKFSDISSNQESTFITDVLLASVDEHFMHHAKDDVKRCWPNLRATMQMTSATTDDDENM